jgi:hypothetical protein
MFTNYGDYEKDIVRFSGTPIEVSYTGENIVAVTIWDKRKCWTILTTYQELVTVNVDT